MDMIASIQHEIASLLEKINANLAEIGTRPASPANLPEALYYSAQCEALLQLYTKYSTKPVTFANQTGSYHEVNQRMIESLKSTIDKRFATISDSEPSDDWPWSSTAPPS